MAQILYVLNVMAALQEALVELVLKWKNFDRQGITSSVRGHIE